MVNFEIFKNNEKTIVDVNDNGNVGDIIKEYSQISKVQIERIALRSEIKGKNLKHDIKINTLANRQLFFRDLGPQIPWKTVFLAEYAGPYFIYPIFFFRPSFIYGEGAINVQTAISVKLALFCSMFHYGKRLYETQYVHRFSHGTMPQINLIKNCLYYWGFSAFMAYFINHPSYTEPYFGFMQVFLGFTGFALAEFGNYSIHILLRNLRPEGSKVRKIPRPNDNPFTILFDYVSCPNYTYEVLAWFSFTIMTQSFSSLLFTTAGFFQMSIWAIQKHHNYIKEFPDYPKERKSIIPFIF
uniref:S5A_REDUCTASE domain-containing protein n=1 Tax=Parastrongyloides trichosuri TaxID=131310 RepID=A0A0N4ZZ50_PARTI